MKKKVYVAPIVEVLEVKVEKGFQVSGSVEVSGEIPMTEYIHDNGAIFF